MPLRAVRLRAGCKINLYLRVGGKLPNGYHELDTLFLPLSEPGDILEIRREDGGRGSPGDRRGGGSEGRGIAVEFSVGGIDPARNTLTRAYAWFASLTGFAPALRVRVSKNVPHRAGLGGGSADAAALLRWLREQAAGEGYPVPTEAEFVEGAAELGADVPFFLLGTAARASGVGEKLVPVANNPCDGRFIVLVCPDIAVSTAWAFAALDEIREAQASPATGRAPRIAARNGREQKNGKVRADGLTSTGHQDIYSLAQGAAMPGNDFEDLVFTRYPQLGRLYRRLCGTGAEMTRMSGTGSSIFALFGNGEMAEAAAKGLASEGYRVYMQAL